MADLRDEILKLGGGRISGSRVFIPLKGRDPGDFTSLLQFGQVEVKADQIILKLNSAQRKVMALERAADRAARRAEKAALKQTRATRRGRFFGATDEGANIGPLSLTRTGARLNQRFLRAGAGSAFTVAIAGNVVGGLMSAAADVGDKVAELQRSGKSTGDIARIAVGQAAQGLRTTIEDYSGAASLVEGVLRLGGLSEEDVQAAIARTRAARADPDTLAKLRERKRDVVLESQRQVERFFAKLWDTINSTRPEGFTLRGRRELEIYRRDMRAVNGPKLEIRQDALENIARRKAYNSMREVP